MHVLAMLLRVPSPIHSLHVLLDKSSHDLQYGYSLLHFLQNPVTDVNFIAAVGLAGTRDVFINFSSLSHLIIHRLLLDSSINV